MLIKFDWKHKDSDAMYNMSWFKYFVSILSFVLFVPLFKCKETFSRISEVTEIFGNSSFHIIYHFPEGIETQILGVRMDTKKRNE